MRKVRANAAKLAAKRHKAALRRKKASDELRLEPNWEYIIAAWLATKPKGERWGLLERYATSDEVLDAIRQDTASHAAMAEALEYLANNPAILAAEPEHQTSVSEKPAQAC